MSKSADRLDLIMILRNVQTPLSVISNFQYPMFMDQQTNPSFTKGTNAAIINIHGIKIDVLFNICPGVICERNIIVNITRKYSSKSLKRTMGVRMMQQIIARNDMILERGSRFSRIPGILSTAQPQFHRAKTKVM